ncbi:MAG: IS1634 family transposase [bacterium]
MFVKKNIKRVKGKVYRQYLLVDSVRTPNGPRHRPVVSLGDMKPRPAKEWLKLAMKVEESLAGQLNLFDKTNKEVLEIVEKIRKKRRFEDRKKEEKDIPKKIIVNPQDIETTEHREFGPSFVVSFFWDLLNFDNILEGVGLSKDAVKLTLITVANRLISPTSDLDTPNWADRTAICELAGYPQSRLNDDKLYRLLDKLYPRREGIEKALYQQEMNLFNLEGSVVLIDFTSFYFEGTCKKNRKAKRGYSRDKRADCKQLVLGAAIGKEGFPIATEIFEGNAVDSPTFPWMLKKINKRVDIKGRTLVFDRGIGTKKNIEFLRSQQQDKGYKWIMASRYWEISQEEEEEIEKFCWKEIPLTGKVAGKRDPKVKVKLLKVEGKEELISLVFSEGREEKDRAIRKRQEKEMEEDIKGISKRIETGRLKDKDKIWQAVGRLRERYLRVSRYYKVSIEEKEDYQELSWSKDDEGLRKVQEMDGVYLLRTNKIDIDEEEIFRTYNLLSRIENVFKDLKGPIKTHPNRHHRDDRSETHIFQGILALHIMTAIEQRLKECGDHREWETIRKALSTHQTCLIVIPATNGETYNIRKPSKMEEEHYEIYHKLGIIKEDTPRGIPAKV